MKKLLISIIIFTLTFSISFADVLGTNEKHNSILDHMKGRNIIGLNFMPAIGTLALNLGLDYIISDNINNEVGKYSDKSAHTKFSGFGILFNYDFTISRYISLGIESGFAKSSFDFNIEGDAGNLYLDYNTISYALGIKFFPKGKAPWGFYLYPKFGGTILNFKATSESDVNELVDNPTDLLPNEILDKTFNSHGIYLSLEVGWRIQLFPKIGKDWPVQVGIDIALFDIGYYLTSWGASDIINSFGGAGTIPSQYEYISRIRLLPMPRLGFSILF